MAARKAKKAEPPTPPAPYITAPDWLVDARDAVATLRDEAHRSVARASKKTFDYENLDEMLNAFLDLESHAVTAYLAVDKAIEAADRAEMSKVDILEALKDAYNRVRRISA